MTVNTAQKFICNANLHLNWGQYPLFLKEFCVIDLSFGFIFDDFFTLINPWILARIWVLLQSHRNSFLIIMIKNNSVGHGLVIIANKTS